MAALTAAEVEPGLVAFLDQVALASDERVCHTQDLPEYEARPFVCIDVDQIAGVSRWVPVTTEPRRERLPIRRECRSDGHPQWVRDDQYLTDGANVWVGPKDAFMAASHQEVTEGQNRARLSAAGLEAIYEEVEAQRKRRHRACP